MPEWHVLQLHLIIHKSHLFTWLERRQANVRTSITPECITQRAVPTGANLALHCKVHLIQVVRIELREVCIGVGALRFIFGIDSLRKTACAVFASSAPLGVGFAGFGWSGC